MYFQLNPEVAGELGETTVIDNSTHPPRVSKLEYQFDGWLGDDLLEAFPSLIVTDKLRNELDQSGLTGFRFDDVAATKSPTFTELHPNLDLPKFHWLQVFGIVGSEDFALKRSGQLVVSERALELLRHHNITHADVEELKQ
jgi:hypothetical protein